MKVKVIFVLCIMFVAQINYSQKMQQEILKINTPIAQKKSHLVTSQNGDREDNYFWMRLSDEQKNSEKLDTHAQQVVNYLNDENNYRTSVMASSKSLETKIFEEIKSKIKQNDNSVPVLDNGFYYRTKYEEGGEYPIFERSLDELCTTTIPLLNVNELAKGKNYYNLGALEVSDNNKIMAYSYDDVSRRIYTIKFKNLETNELLDDVITNAEAGIVWANDNKTIYYTRKDEQTLRSFQVFRHKLGTSEADDELIFEEKDETFFISIDKSTSKKFIIIQSSATLNSEVNYLSADDENAQPKIFFARDLSSEHLFSVDHINNQWYIITNKDAKNNRIAIAKENHTNYIDWEILIPHSDKIYIENMTLLDDYLNLTILKEGISEILVHQLSTSNQHFISLPEKAHTVSVGNNPESSSVMLRINYTSMTTPNTTFDYSIEKKELIFKKEMEVLGGFNKDEYRSERIFITARDGIKVPVSLVYHKNTKIDGTAPILVYGYGSYGITIEPTFSISRLSLLDRGFVFAIAHIRGGSDLGKQWYEDGKLLKKMNTFYDFIDVTKSLVNLGYGDKNKVFAKGGSAGGLLMGAVANLAPELYNGMLVGVPFVDVVSTMLDATIPLTTFEYDEWGNPENSDYYHYMMKYSPIDNISRKDYPAMLITTGLFDSQVQYWEPAKYIAKLRDYKTNNSPLLLYCNMETGHGGASGRFQKLYETAMEWTFLFDLLKIRD